MLKYNFLLCILLLASLMAGCKKKKEQLVDTFDGIRYNKVDITNTVGFYTKASTVASGFGAGNYDVYKIYRILDNGSVQELQYFKNDQPYKKESFFQKAFDVSKDYFFLISSYGGASIRKSDGALKEFSGVNIYGTSYQQGALNQVYVIQDRKIKKINILSSEQVNVETIVDEGYSAIVNDFAVDPSGNIIYIGYASDHTPFFKLRRSDNTTSNLVYSDNRINFLWSGYNDSLYCITSPLNLGNGNFNDIWKVTPTNPYQIQTYHQNNYVTTNYLDKGQLKRIRNKSKVLAYYTYGIACGKCGNAEVVEIYTPNHSRNRFKLIDFSISKMTDYTTSDNYLYLAGTNNSGQKVIVKVDTDTRTYTTVYNNSNIEISLLRVDKNENIYFVGLRLNDGKNVLMRYDSQGNTILLDDQLVGLMQDSFTFLGGWQ
jgi:hypothetical protein